MRRQQGSAGGLDQLRRDTQLITRAQQRAHYHTVDVRLGGQRFEIRGFSGESCRAGARAQHQGGYARQRRRDGVGQAEGQKVGLRIGSEHTKRQHDQTRERLREHGGVVLIDAADGAQLLGHRLRRWRPLRRPLRQRSTNHTVDGGDRRRSRQGRGLLVARGVQHFDHRSAGKGRTSGQHLEQDGAGSEEIAAGVDGFPCRLFRRHVARRPHYHPDPRHFCDRVERFLDVWPRESEVQHLDAVGGQEHVRRFEIAMDDAARVQS